MRRAIRNTAAVTLSGLAIGAAIAGFAPREASPQSAAGPSLFESLMLMQYGYGAYDEPQTASQGEKR